MSGTTKLARATAPTARSRRTMNSADLILGTGAAGWLGRAC